VAAGSVHALCPHVAQPGKRTALSVASRRPSEVLGWFTGLRTRL
jgi:hypothetical protein